MKDKIKYSSYIFIFIICLFVLSKYYNNYNNNIIENTKELFKYKGDGFFIISGHRGGSLEYPENSIESLSKLDSLEDMIVWSKSNTIINLDVKDVPIKQKIDLVKKNNAFSTVIFTVHNSKQAELFFNNEKNSLFSAWILDEKQFYEYDKSIVPWENILIAYVGSKVTKENLELKEKLHKKGVMVMISTASSYDKYEEEQRKNI